MAWPQRVACVRVAHHVVQRLEVLPSGNKVADLLAAFVAHFRGHVHQHNRRQQVGVPGRKRSGVHPAHRQAAKHGLLELERLEELEDVRNVRGRLVVAFLGPVAVPVTALVQGELSAGVYLSP